MIKKLFLFLKSKQFLTHFFIALVSLAVLFWFVFLMINRYTLHGQVIEVQDFKGMSVNDASKIIHGKEMQYLIVDSVHDPKQKGGIIINQDPEPKSSVKKGRTIYLTVTAQTAPMVKMPNLVDASLRQAVAMLESYGLKFGKSKYRPAQCANCVLEQTLKGKRIEPGKMILKNSMIDLVLGRGESDEQASVPCLSGMTKDEAIDRLVESGLSEGAIIFEDCKTSKDSTQAKVYKYFPGCSSENSVNLGSSVDMYLTTKAEKIKKEEPSDNPDEDIK